MITISDAFLSVFFYLLENNLCKESWRALQPNTNILTTILQNCHNKRLPILIILELCLFKTFYIFQSAKIFNLFYILCNIAQLNNDTLAINLNIPNHLILCRAIFKLGKLNFFEFLFAILI